MNRTEIREALDQITKGIQDIDEPKISIPLNTMVNLVEVLVEENSKLKAEKQKLQDEVNRLKGEQGKPNIRKQSPKDENNDHSSEDERKDDSKKPPKKKNKKKQTVKINRTQKIEIDKEDLPEDAVFKGYETRIIQDIKLNTDNIEFYLATYYSSSLKKTFIAKMPKGYHGEFGPGIRSIVLTLYRDSNMTETAIKRFMETIDIHISKSTISRMITEGHDVFHQEKEDIVDAGLKSTAYQHLDDTGCRENGQNYYNHIICNPYFTAFFTRARKDRLTLMEILSRSELKFEFSQKSYELMAELKLANKWLLKIEPLLDKGTISHAEMDNLLSSIFPNPKKHKKSKRIISEATAMSYYHSAGLQLEHLMCDNAPQFNKLAKHKGLCWIHEGRHYKKLRPIYSKHINILKEFITRFWEYYRKLKLYKQHPSKELAKELVDEFALLFATKTGYDKLDERIAITLMNKDTLLKVIEFSYLPLHNNPAELGARVQARMRDINLQTISKNGTRSKDTFTTIVQTARKLGVNIYNYIYDRISEKFEMTSLANLITQKAAASNSNNP